MAGFFWVLSAARGSGKQAGCPCAILVHGEELHTRAPRRSTSSHAEASCLIPAQQGPPCPGIPAPQLPLAQPQVTGPPLSTRTQLGGQGSCRGCRLSPASLSPQPFLESPAILRCENASSGCQPSSCPTIGPPRWTLQLGGLEKGPRFTCLLGGGDWLKLLESLLSELWGMAPVSGSQGLFSFLYALGVPAFCLASLPSPLASSVPCEMALWLLVSRPSRRHAVLCDFLCLSSQSLCTFPLGLGLLWFLRTLGM